MVSLDSGAARAALARQGIDYTEWVFFNAASVGYLETVQLFVEAGMSVNIADNEYGATALHGAARFGRFEIVQYLSGQRASLSARDNEGATPLLWAARGGHLSVVRFLVEHGADVNARTNGGDTPRDLALRRDHTDVSDYLESQGG